MYAFPLDFREILQNNRETIFTYFPEENLLFDGKKTVPNMRTFWFDSELYSSGIRGFGEVFARTNKIKELAEEFEVSSYLSAREKLETYCKVYHGVPSSELFKKLVPKELVLQYGKGLAEISEAIFEKRTKPSNYSFLLDERDLIEEIWNRELNLKGPSLDKKTIPRVMYDMYRGVTGRLNHAPRSFPILSLARERRAMVAPSGDIFVEYDMQSADFRTFLYLFSNDPGKYEEVQDLYADIPGDTRAEKKQKVFQTIYASNENAFLKRHGVFPKALDKISREDERYVWIVTPFGREVRIDKSKGSLEHLIVSYLIQSVTNDLAIQAALKVRKILEGTGSHIAFLIHDCFVVDFKKEDYEKFRLDIRESIGYSDQNLNLGNGTSKLYWHELVGENFGTLIDVEVMEHENDRRSDEPDFGRSDTNHEPEPDHINGGSEGDECIPESANDGGPDEPAGTPGHE